MVKSGIGVRVGSGSPRSYYIGVAAANAGDGGHPGQAVCLVERGLEEGSTIYLPEQNFKVKTNQPVSIDLFSSSFRSGDRTGDVVDLDETLTSLPPLNTVIQFGKKGVVTEIPVRLEAIFTEVGTLELYCRSLDTPHRWKLRFQLRGALDSAMLTENEVFEASVVDTAKHAVQNAFTSSKSSSRLPRLMSEIVDITGRPKGKWPLSLLRELADTLLDDMALRSGSVQAECRWMNLLGFCMRPGMGEGFDSHRIKTIWKNYKKGPIHANAPQVRAEWWILWRRVAAGLNPGQQRQFFQDVSTLLATKRRSRVPKPEYIEMWMALASMERLSVKDKANLGDQLIQGFNNKKPSAQLLWALSRIGARELLYGSIDRVLPPSEVSGWITFIVSTIWKNPKPAVETISQLCRRTGDPLRDIPSESRSQVIAWMKAAGDFAEALGRVTDITPRRQHEADAVFGEALPAGLILEGRHPNRHAD